MNIKIKVYEYVYEYTLENLYEILYKYMWLYVCMLGVQSKFTILFKTEYECISEYKKNLYVHLKFYILIYNWYVNI